MSTKDIVSDLLYSQLNNAKSTIYSCESCLSEGDYEQAMVRLQMLGVNFTQFECEIISEVTKVK